MKFLMWSVLLLMEYGLAKIVWLLLESMVFNGLSPVIGIICVGLFGSLMIGLWIWGRNQIND